jgi:outer membrane murein-binding lipoprotein Lpp
MENRLLIALMVLASLLVGCADPKQVAALHSEVEQQKKDIQELRSRIDGLSRSAVLDADEKCAKQAEAEFKERAWEKGWTASFTNHYNGDLGKCFLLFESTSTTAFGGETIQKRFLFDAYERKQYGTYWWSSSSGKKYWEVKPRDCQVTMPSGEKKTCGSEDEFNELLKTYMGRGAP